MYSKTEQSENQEVMSQLQNMLQAFIKCSTLNAQPGTSFRKVMANIAPKKASGTLIQEILAAEANSLNLTNKDMDRRSEADLIALVDAMKNTVTEVNLSWNGFVNKLSNLIILNKKMEEKLPNLVSLNLSNNTLAMYDGGQYEVQDSLEGIFLTVPKVKFLDLSTNSLGNSMKLDEYLSSLCTVVAMNLSDNGLCDIKEIVESVSAKVTYIDLSANDFDELPLQRHLARINQMQPARSDLKIHFGESTRTPAEQEQIRLALAAKGITLSADNYQAHLASRTAQASAAPQAFFAASARPAEEVKTRAEDQATTTHQI